MRRAEQGRSGEGRRYIATYEIRLMFEWRGPCLWGMNDAAKAAFGYAIQHDTLPLTDATKTLLDDLGMLHDEALDWKNPAGPSPWSQRQFDDFERLAAKALGMVQRDLGADFSVRYEPVGGPNVQS